MRRPTFLLVLSLAAGCSVSHSAAPDLVRPDRGREDAAPPDAAPPDASIPVVAMLDASTPDASTPDTSISDEPLEPPRWEPIGASIACSGHTATSLAGGDVLLVGTCTLDGEPVWAMRYDAVSRTARALAPLEPRSFHAAVSLEDGGALVIAGLSAEDVSLPSTELFDPDTDSFRPGPLLRNRRTAHAALRSGDQVVVAGGRLFREEGRCLVASVESIDLVTGLVTELPPLRAGREDMVLAARPDGLVVVGGRDSSRHSNIEHLVSGEVEPLPGGCSRPSTTPDGLDVACSGDWLDVSPGVRVVASLEIARYESGIARLPDGALFVLGGGIYSVDPPPERLTALGTSALLPPPTHRYLSPTVTLLPDGTVLVVGEEAAEIFVPALEYLGW